MSLRGPSGIASDAIAGRFGMTLPAVSAFPVVDGLELQDRALDRARASKQQGRVVGANDLASSAAVAAVPIRAQAARRRHGLPGWWGLWLVLGVGVALRAADLIGYRRALLLYGDSYAYLIDAVQLTPSGQHPLGYPMFLALLRPSGFLVVVPVVQHLLGVALGLGTYTLLQRLGARRSFAVLGSAPVLLDPYQIQLEQFILSETLTSVLLLAAFALVFVPERTSVRLCALAGVVMAWATLSRTVAGLVLVPLVVTVVARRRGWLAPAVLAGAAGLPLLLYVAWFHSSFGHYGFDNLGGRAVYARTARIADCARLRLPAPERQLCDPVPRAERKTPNFYAWEAGSPLYHVHLPRGVSSLELAGSFNKHVIEQQPLDYAGVVARDIGHYLGVNRVSGPNDWPVASWQQQAVISPRQWHVLIGPSNFAAPPYPPDKGLPGKQATHLPVPWLRMYQRVLYVPGIAVAVAGLFGMVAAFRFRLLRQPKLARLRAFTAVSAISALMLVVVPGLIVPFDFRYLLPAQLLVGPALIGGLELWVSAAASALQASRQQAAQARRWTRKPSAGAA